MSLPKRGSRPLEVDGVRYRWRLRGRATAGQRSGATPLLIAIAAEEGEGPAMIVRHLAHPRRAAAERHYTRAITPAEVAAHVREGIAAGWRPKEPGPAFTYQPEWMPASPRAPRIYPPGLAPPGPPRLRALARERAEGRAPYDSLRIWAGPPEVPGAAVEINGQDLIDLVREVERPLVTAEVAARRAAGEALAPDTDYSGQYAGLSLARYLLPTRALVDEPACWPADAFRIDDDHPCRRKTTLLACTCGIDECWFLMATITVVEDAVIWSDFEQFHREWVYDLGPFVFARAAYLAALAPPAG
ncbi:MAG: hypothetical protein R3B09_34085 [Nannocystaceae bacterium]